MASPKAPLRQLDDLTGTTVGRFRVEALLGAGGMGEVYRAVDTKLKRTVALKRVGPQFRSDPERIHRMFKEAERASALNHPCVASVYDILEQNTDVFLVMEYVEGISLRQRMREGISPQELTAIAIQCADALQAAHEKGIVHGDVKPENIMLTPGGGVKLLDFGVARRMLAGPEISTTMHPGMGGTWGYMAPEVLLQRFVDGRSDLFSLGVVLYEGLTRKQPFYTDTLAVTIDRTLHQRPSTVSSSNPAVPAQLAAIVDRLLDKEPERRCSSAGELARELRGLGQGSLLMAPAGRMRLPARRLLLYTALLLALMVAVAVLRSMRRRPASVGQLPATRYVAILPFRSPRASAGDQAYAAGLAATLSSTLAKVSSRQLQVAPGSEIQAMQVTDARAARRALGVNLVLEGTLYRGGETVRIAYSLVDPATLHPIRSDEVTAPAGDPYALEQELRRSVARALELGSAAAGAQPQPGATTAAYQNYLRGEGYLQEVAPESADSAIAAFKQALTDDPAYVPARSSLGLAYLNKFSINRQREWLDQAAHTCRSALASAPQDAVAHLCLGLTFNESGQPEQAVAQLKEAIRLDGSNDAAYSGLGYAYWALGDLPQAQRYYEHAVELRPGYWAGYSKLGRFYERIGRYGEAAAQFQRAVALAPEISTPHYNLGGVLLRNGEYEQAVAALRRGIALAPDYRAYSNLGSAYLALHQYEAAVDAFEQAYRMGPTDYIAVGNLARGYYWAGKADLSRQKYRDAIRMAKEALAANPKDVDAHMLLAGYFAMLGDKPNARDSLRRARQLHHEDGELWFFAALVHARFGEQLEALRAIERSVALGYSRSDIRTSPEFESLRGNADFDALVRAQ